MTSFLNGFEEEVQTDFNNPGSLKSGEYLYSAIHSRAQRFIDYGKRNEVIAVARYWIHKQIEPETMIAIKLSSDFQFNELLKDIETLNEAVISGRILQPFYSETITPVIQSLRQNTDDES
jgi:hypothetical protein